MNNNQRVIIILFIMATIWNCIGFSTYLEQAYPQYVASAVAGFTVREAVILLCGGALILLFQRARA